MKRKLRDVERDYDCEFCKSQKGERCVRRDGAIAAEPHLSRINQWYQAGLRDGSIREVSINIRR